MDANEALAELRRISPDVEHAAVVDDEGELVAATAGAPAAGLARAAVALFDAAAGVHAAAFVDRVEVDLPTGSVIAVRGRGHVVIAATRPEPVGALVVHDLRACIERLASPGRRAGRRRGTSPDA